MNNCTLASERALLNILEHVIHQISEIKLQYPNNHPITKNLHFEQLNNSWIIEKIRVLLYRKTSEEEEEIKGDNETSFSPIIEQLVGMYLSIMKCDVPELEYQLNEGYARMLIRQAATCGGLGEQNSEKINAALNNLSILFYQLISGRAHDPIYHVVQFSSQPTLLKGQEEIFEEEGANEESVTSNTLAIVRCYFVQLLHLFITRLPYSAVGTGCSHELSIPMGRPSKNKESGNGRKSGPFQKFSFVQWAGYAINAYIGHQFEPCSRFARRATGFRRISVRSTVSAHCCHQRKQQAKEPHCPMELKLKNNGKTIVDIINRDKK
ncbi:MAG: hypothetical protein EZS28_016753 [Streblomastix strix]|uniref:Uncharacterized protein n=1 Tax=Streblomastix strix TaxID=222440 RepID=A0A5J4VZQ6_9EUKA|nr:MAG: hypothetical protein EZS28_016753 [Streblomastix strix]